MTIVESRVVKGVFTLGTAPGTPFSCQPTNIRVTPSYDDDGDPVETLCGDNIPAGKKESWVLAGTAIQDFDDPEGFLTYCYENAMVSTAFTWQPNITGAPTFSGNVVVEALEEGGDVNTRLTSDWEWDVAGRPDREYDQTTNGAPAADVVEVEGIPAEPGEPAALRTPSDTAPDAELTTDPETAP